MRESPIERKVCQAAKEDGWVVHPKTRGRSGWPDRTFSKPQVTFFIEFKAPGKVPRALQERTLSDLRARGFEAHVIDNVEDGIALIKRMSALVSTTSD